MDNLTKYINEYGKISKCWPFEYYRVEPETDYRSSYLALGWDDNWEWDWKEWYLEIPRLISKEYGFIKWLVENDRVKIPHELDELPQIYWVDYNSNECKSDRLIMLLSISDTPIEDLILYLK